MATGPLIYDEKTYRPTTHSRAAAMIYLKNNKLQENKKEEASFWEAFSKQWVEGLPNFIAFIADLKRLADLPRKMKEVEGWLKGG